MIAVRSPRHRGILMLTILALTASPLAAQDPAGEADAALAACIAAVEANQEPEAKAQADRADRLFSSLEDQPGKAADGLTGRARVLAQCRVPFAGFMRQGELVEASMELARRALAIDATHLGARFILGADLYHMPAFLNRTDEAIATLEGFLERHRETNDTRVPTAFAWLGDLYERANRSADAIRIWREGLTRFPGDPALEQRLAKQGGETPALEAPPEALPRSSQAAATSFALPPIVVLAGGVSVDEARGATRLNRTDVYTAPGGAADVMQVFQTMPGVTRTRDGSDLYVRGGTPAESPVFVNGARLLHAGTFESLNGSVFGLLDPAGESGTGKELAARAVHEQSARSRREFIALNCSAMPGELVESELFGSVRGAFTGADRDREGLFHAATGGTLFLDEIGDLAPAAQAKLLRAIEERAVLRVGATREESVDTRVIAATNQPLDESAASGRFREDLLYRLAVITLRLPPLRERREDIIPLAIHFLSTFARRHGRPSRALTETARHALCAYDWPGNVRELRNALERAVVLAEGEAIDVADLPAALRHSDLPLSASEAALAELPFADARDRALHAFERAFISAALERQGGNVSAAARALGLHRQSLQRIMRRLEL